LLAQATALAQQQEQWAAWEEAEHEERVEERVALTNTLQQQIKEEFKEEFKEKCRNEFQEEFKEEHELSMREEKNDWNRKTRTLENRLKEETNRCLLLEERNVKSTAMVDDLQKQCETSEMQCHGMAKKLQTLTGRLHESEKRNEAHASQILLLQQTQKDEEHQHEEIQIQLQAQENQQHILQETQQSYSLLKSTHDKQSQQHKQEMATVLEKHALLKNQLKEEKENNAFLQEEIVQINEFANDIDSSNEKEIETLKEQLETTKTNHETCLIDLERIQHNYDTEKQVHLTTLATAAAQESQLREAFQTSLQAEEKIEQLEQCINTAATVHEQKMVQHEHDFAELKTELASSTSLSAASNEQKKALSVQVEKLTHDFEICERTMQRQQASLKDKTKVVDQLKNHFQQYTTVQEKEVEVVTARVHALEQEVIQLTQEKDLCTQELQSLQQHGVENDASMKFLATTASARVVSLEQEVVHLTKEKNKCAQELQQVQQQYLENDASASARVQTLEQELQTLQQQCLQNDEELNQTISNACREADQRINDAVENAAGCKQEMVKVQKRTANETKALAKKHSTEMKKIQDYDKSKTMLFNKEIANLKNKIVELKQQHDVYCHDNNQQKTQMQQELHDEIHGTVVEPLQSRKEQRDAVQIFVWV
jgi:polyhydroxyalkanoate synthesis regulator phasin